MKTNACYVPTRNSDNINNNQISLSTHHLKQGITIELTVPADEHLAQANFRKN